METNNNISFKDLKMKNYKQPTNIKDIRNFEKKMEIILPNDYVQWLLKYNGGTPVIEDAYDLIEPYKDWYDRDVFGSGIHYFDALGIEGLISNLEKPIRWIGNRIPKDIYPIAANKSGDDICIGIKGERFNKVYLWLHEEEAPDGQEPWYDNVYLIANSFVEFINGFYRYEIHDPNDPDDGEYIIIPPSPPSDLSFRKYKPSK